jgi:predicted DNA-binding helix-hairpin-helix protein
MPRLGKRVIHEGEEYRPFKTLSQFRREIGKNVDAEVLARLPQYVFVPVNLNTASDEDILSIPGMGAKMLLELEEYRPYLTMEQFRREIGKYVNTKELARLESYVTLGEGASESKRRSEGVLRVPISSELVGKRAAASDGGACKNAPPFKLFAKETETLRGSS